MEFARSVGWVSSAEQGAALKDAHFQDLSYQQGELSAASSAQANDDGSLGDQVCSFGDIELQCLHCFLLYRQWIGPFFCEIVIH